MKRRFSYYRGLAALVLCGSMALTMPPALAIPLAKPQAMETVMPVASDCYAVGQRVAAQKGGTLARASQATRGGQPVCVIVVLVPGKNGQRPRRAEIVVPQG